MTFDLQVNSVRDNHYREWRGGSSRTRRAALAPEVGYDARETGRRRRASQLVPATRVRRSEHENQLNGAGGTRFDVNVRYQGYDDGAGIKNDYIC